VASSECIPATELDVLCCRSTILTGSSPLLSSERVHRGLRLLNRPRYPKTIIPLPRIPPLVQNPRTCMKRDTRGRHSHWSRWVTRKDKRSVGLPRLTPNGKLSLQSFPRNQEQHLLQGSGIRFRDPDLLQSRSSGVLMAVPLACATFNRSHDQHRYQVPLRIRSSLLDS
jgi:hypothetical protein